MKPAPQEISTCSNCGGVLEETPGGGLGCMSCLLRAGIGSEEEVAKDSNPNAFEDGGRFGVYEIDCHPDGSLYELGRGAMGVTYRATDTSLQRKVALKIIKADIAEGSADARERFMREARAAAGLRHENIATIHQFGMRLETGQYFYAMELIEGETLEERVRRGGPLDARTTIRIAQQVTSALAAAEKCGLVHRDLKPANLMLVSSDGERARVTNNTKLLVKIIDFGLAKAIHTQTDPKSLTHDRFVGTPAFASPEQFEHSALDVRSDIYSLGETLWFALTGKTPFTGRSMEEIHRAQKSNVLPVEQLKAAHVSSRLKTLLESMLALEPASRPGTQELAVRLQRCSPEARTVRRTRVALVAAALVILGMSALFVFQPSRIQNAALNPAADKSIAVLPFENRSEDNANAYFADGIQDEILTRLSKIADLKVISRTSTQQYQSKPRNLREIAKQLGVAHILEGSVQKSGDAVRVNVQLIKAANDSHLWADTFDRKLTDILSVESEVAKAIADQLRAKLTGREEQVIAAKPTDNPEAYDAYLRGLAYSLKTANTSANALGAQKYLKEAVRLDPKFALAWALLSYVESRGYITQFLQPTVALRDDAQQAAERALTLQPTLGEAILAKGFYHYACLKDYDTAVRYFEQARPLLPNSSRIPELLAYVTRRQGQWDRSESYFNEAERLDPRNVSLLTQHALSYRDRRMFPEALRKFEQILNITPDDLDTIVEKAVIAQAEGDLPRASALLASVQPAPDDTNALETQAYQSILERRPTQITSWLKELLAKPDPALGMNKGELRFWLGWTQEVTGDHDAAQESWRQARSELESFLKEQPENHILLGDLALTAMSLGDKVAALTLSELGMTVNPIEKDAVTGPASIEFFARVAVQAGEADHAITALQKLLSTAYAGPLGPGAPLTPALLRLDPMFDPLRNDPRFQKLCEDKLDKRIAVLPFENLSDPHDEYFSDGLSEELISALAQISELKVIGRSSSFRFKDRKEEPKTIGEKLGVSTLLEGTVRKEGNRVRIVAALTNAADGIELWTRTFDRELKDIFAVQEEIAKAVADSLKVRLLGSDDRSAQRAAPNGVEAHNAYLQGHFYFERGNLEDFRKSVGYFDQAIQLDPNYALAYAERSEAWTLIGDLSPEQNKQARTAARSDAEKAVVIDPNLADAHAALGWVRFFVEWKFAEGLSELKRAKELSPANPSANFLLGLVTVYLGRVDEAERQARQAVELDPLSFKAQRNLARVLLVGGKLDEVDTAARKAAELQPAAAGNHSYQVLVAIERGDGETALREAQLEPDEGYRRYELALAHYVRGDRAAADAALTDLIANGRDQFAYQIAEVYAVRGEVDKAFEWLQISFENHDTGLLLLLTDRWLRGLRDDPRYKAILEKVGLPGSL